MKWICKNKCNICFLEHKHNIPHEFDPCFCTAYCLGDGKEAVICVPMDLEYYMKEIIKDHEENKNES